MTQPQRVGPFWLLVALSACSAPAPDEAARTDESARSDDAERTDDADPSAFAGMSPQTPATFQDAKQLAWGVYAEHRRTFYCDCDFGADRALLTAACGYVPLEDTERAHRIEWEHVVPAAAFGRHRACWSAEPCYSEGERVRGRECCTATDPEFRRMEADLQNLVPEIGELNEDRSDYSYGLIDGEVRSYGSCDFEVDEAARLAEPRAELLGDVARITLYMHEVYGEDSLPLSDETLDALWAWHAADPPSAWERERNARIGDIQGEINPLVGVP
jgi:deoxyribonuclease-1